jgi:hypothetical protein
MRACSARIDTGDLGMNFIACNQIIEGTLPSRHCQQASAPRAPSRARARVPPPAAPDAWAPGGAMVGASGLCIGPCSAHAEL